MLSFVHHITTGEGVPSHLTGLEESQIHVARVCEPITRHCVLNCVALHQAMQWSLLQSCVAGSSSRGWCLLILLVLLLQRRRVARMLCLQEEDSTRCACIPRLFQITCLLACSQYVSMSGWPAAALLTAGCVDASQSGMHAACCSPNVLLLPAFAGLHASAEAHVHCC